MKSSIMSLWLLAAAAYGTPIERRQGSTTSNELKSGKCGDVVFIFARGSTESGNMGMTVGPPTCRGIKQAFPGAVCQGVGGGYTASIGGNLQADGTTAAAKREAATMFALAASQCPDAAVVAGGYSQGAALIAAAVTALPAQQKEQVKGVVLYGYTKNRQNNGQIPNYPAARTKVFCNASDGVCGGGLAVTAGHLTYTSDVNAAVEFLQAAVRT
ncbi:hypothetical protein CBER1_10301 [Cercospora berteroae]|uniref:Cutinase n=1 Tax=Cercospora berteroae TaxID=357750 RepID=A0A2S6CN88_9PEZI|nr:hypothetical protein CBER1_10301 [Cercospora berteroae]